MRRDVKKVQEIIKDQLNKKGFTALFIAAICGHADVVKFLVGEGGASANKATYIHRFRQSAFEGRNTPGRQSLGARPGPSQRAGH